MSAATVDEVTVLWERAMALPANFRIALARRLLETSEAEHPSYEPNTPNPSQRGLSADELSDLLKSDVPPPDDETVKRWIHEYRMEKYG